MKKIIFAILLLELFQSCHEKNEISSIDPVNWENRSITYSSKDSLISGATYLSVYSQIYSYNEHRTHNLTSTISMRNTNRNDTLFISTAEYYNTEGDLIRNYFSNPIFLAPMETVEIVIDEVNGDGGTGANFIFDWKVKPETNEPLFEAIMISTSGQQGLSFSTQGIKIR